MTIYTDSSEGSEKLSRFHYNHMTFWYLIIFLYRIRTSRVFLSLNDLRDCLLTSTMMRPMIDSEF